MKPEELNLIIKEGEGLTVEFKAKYTPKIDRDIVAFANSNGGILLFGIGDDGKVVGEKLTNRMKAEIHAIARNCDPAIHIKSLQQLDEVVVVEVAEGDEKPYSSSSGYFRRLDAVTQKMTQKEVRLLFRETDSVSFEGLTARSSDVNNISLQKIRAFLKEAKISHKVTKANLPLVLSSVGVFDKGRLSNAGALMFASNVGYCVPHAETIMVAFKGTDRVHIYDRKDVRDDLLMQFNEAVAFLQKHLNIRSEIRGVNRHDIYEIPLDALREAVVNAIVHRDYSFRGTSIYVRVFDDRVEIESPGGFAHGVTMHNLGTSSVRRNPVIADLFHRMDKVERIGSGIRRIRELIRSAGLKEPVFQADAFFRAVFPRDPQFALKKVGDRVGEKVGDRVGDRLTDHQATIIKTLQESPRISAKALSEIVGISPRKTEANLAKLKKIGKIKRIGSTKSGHWEVVEQ